MALPATDAFTTGADAALTTYSASWTNNNGAFQVLAASDDVHSNSADTETGAHWNADTFGADQYSQLTVVNVAGACIGVSVRAAASAATWYGYYTDNSSSYLYKIVTGSWSQIGSSGSAATAGQVIRLEVTGASTSTTLTPKLDGSTTGTPGAQTGRNDGIGSGSAGLCGYGSLQVRGDNWEGGNLGATSLAKSATSVTAALSGQLRRTVQSVTAALSQLGTVSKATQSVTTALKQLAIKRSAQIVTANLSVPAGWPESFEDASTANWLVAATTSGTGSTVDRSADQAAVGSYSAKCFTTNSGGVAQVTYTGWSSAWSGVPTTPVYEWQRFKVYVPSATTAALTGAEYLDLAGFYKAGETGGWFLRLQAGATLYGVGTYFGSLRPFNLYGTLPTDQWVDVEIGLWSQNADAAKRSFIVFVNGDCYGWFMLGDGADYDRIAAGILGTNSSDDLTVYVDEWYEPTTGSAPTGADNRPTGNTYTLDYREQDGRNLEYHYYAWGYNTLTLDATYGLTTTDREQSAINQALMADLSDGWSEIEIEWPNGTTPTWPPDVALTYFFAPMIGFRKSIPDEVNLEVVFKFYDADDSVKLVFEAWVSGGGIEYATWTPPVDGTSGQRIPGRGDKIRVRWQEVSASEIRVRVDYYDASTAAWTLDVIDHTEDVSNVSGVNFLDNAHRAVTNTIDSQDYSITYQAIGRLSTFSRVVGNLKAALSARVGRAALAVTAVLGQAGLRSASSVAAVLAHRFGRPCADVGTGSWTTPPLYDKVDEP